MARLSMGEVVMRYFGEDIPEDIVDFDHDAHYLEASDMIPGMVGASLDMGITGMSSLEIGSRIPVIVTTIDKDYIRIFIDPIIEFSKEKGRLAAELIALNLHGNPVHFSTSEVLYPKPHVIAEELLRLYAPIAARDRVITRPQSGNQS